MSTAVTSDTFPKEAEETVSVVVAVYNIEDYLRECVDSILEQTVRPFEVLLIDDGSSDASASICDEYEKRFPCVKVIHQTNAGLSAARNTGLEAARGEWVYFVDGDDILAPDLLESFLRTVASHEGDVDFVQGRMSWFKDGTSELKPDEIYLSDERTYGADSQDVFADAFQRTGFFRMGIRGLYRRSLLIENDLWFVPGLYSEDQEWTPRLFSLGVKMGSNENPGYLYREERAGSIVTARRPEQIAVLFDIYHGWVTQLCADDTLKRAFRDALENEASRRSVEEFYKHASLLEGDDLACVAEIIDRNRDLFVAKPSMSRREKVLCRLVRACGAHRAAHILRRFLAWRTGKEKKRVIEDEG